MKFDYSLSHWPEVFILSALLSGCSSFQVAEGVIYPMGFPPNDSTLIRDVNWNCTEEKYVSWQKRTQSSEKESEKERIVLRRGVLGGIEVTFTPETKDRTWSASRVESLLGSNADEAANCIRLDSTSLAKGLVANAVAELGPRKFSEDLAIRYGYTPELGIVDIVPGMRLRVEGGGTWYATDSAFNIASPLDLDVVETFSTDGRRASVDFVPLLSRLGVSGTRSSEDPTTSVGGIPDIAFSLDLRMSPVGDSGNSNRTTPANELNYWRLLYPESISGIKAFELSAQEGYRILLVGTRDPKVLEEFTTSFIKTGDKKTTTKMCKDGVVCMVFRNRAVPYVTIPVSVNGDRRWVPLGTMLGDLVLQTEGPMASTVHQKLGREVRNKVDGPRVARMLANLKVTRRFGGHERNLVYDQAVDHTRNSDLWKLPLNAGDVISW